MRCSFECTNCNCLPIPSKSDVAVGFIGASWGGGVAYIGAHFITGINPPAAAVFGATFFAVQTFANKIFESMVGGPEATKKAKFVAFFSSVFVSLISTKLILDAIGFAIASDTALILAGTSLLTGAVITASAIAATLLGCGCLYCCVCCYSRARGNH